MMYLRYLPDIIFDDDGYDREYFGPYMNQQEFEQLKAFYSGITEGREDDPTDEVNYMLNKPFEMAMVYEGTGIGDGHESFEIIDEAEKVLTDHHIALPDHNLVRFSPSSEFNGWGYKFDGTHLSIILK